MTKYFLALRASIEQDYSQMTPDDFQRIIAGYETWESALKAENRLLAGQKLTDEGGAVLHPDGDNVTRKDGPYVETKEVLGGYYIIEADGYDHAVQLCEGHPNFRFGSIEIREIDFMGGPDELR